MRQEQEKGVRIASGVVTPTKRDPEAKGDTAAEQNTTTQASPSNSIGKRLG